MYWQHVFLFVVFLLLSCLVCLLYETFLDLYLFFSKHTGNFNSFGNELISIFVLLPANKTFLFYFKYGMSYVRKDMQEKNAYSLL